MSFGKAMLTNAANIRKVDPLTDILGNMMHGLQEFAAIKHLLVLMRKKLNMM